MNLGSGPRDKIIVRSGQETLPTGRPLKLAFGTGRLELLARTEGCC